ncbi:MAG: CDP-glycerol glycerophosphotransferase family protein, partial [Clostridia bacterium]|nr:CDP-glycerol glycerophosphotransferase family protein [Clostridia bacterium]
DFLNSKELLSLLDGYGYELIFYPHFEVHRFLDCFNTSNSRIKIADFKNNDVQDLLINTDILITDYSSVFFDYGYMRKPVVFFQYDEAAFRAEQYATGYFEYKRDGFGKVVSTGAEVANEVRRIIENGLKPDSVYLDKMNSFYAFNDANNCKRNFEAICSLF